MARVNYKSIHVSKFWVQFCSTVRPDIMIIDWVASDWRRPLMSCDVAYWPVHVFAAYSQSPVLQRMFQRNGSIKDSNYLPGSLNPCRVLCAGCGVVLLAVMSGVCATLIDYQPAQLMICTASSHAFRHTHMYVCGRCKRCVSPCESYTAIASQETFDMSGE